MPKSLLLDYLADAGPAATTTAMPLEQAEAYCRRLARSHYENFSVASWLLPGELQQPFYNVYSYCRWADDLADEAPTPEASLRLLDWWEGMLTDCYQGVARHPVFVALRRTIDEFSIPIEPFADLLVAFRQDQTVSQYETIDQLLGYCRNSANPVGRLVLCLGRACDNTRAALADSICTGLQLANFCQDVARDALRGRRYLPLEALHAAGYSEEMFERKEYNAAFCELLRGEVERARGCLEAGRPLIDLAPRALRLEIALFVGGGLSILREIQRIDYNVWARRPTVSKAEKLRLLAGSWWQTRRPAVDGMAEV